MGEGKGLVGGKGGLVVGEFGGGEGGLVGKGLCEEGGGGREDVAAGGKGNGGVAEEEHGTIEVEEVVADGGVIANVDIDPV